MTPLATLEQFAEYRSVDYSGADVYALRALESASALIRSALGQTVTLVEDDVTILDGLGLRGLVLPQHPVLEVSDVTLLNPTGDDEVLELTDFYVDRAGILWRSSYYTTWGWGWPTMRGNVQVTYTHGYEVIPDEAVTLCCSIAARFYASSSSAGQTITSQTIGGASVTYSDSDGGTNARGLTAEEDALLHGYPWTVLASAEAS